MPSETWTPVLGFTMGDPAGIGPEVIVKALANRKSLDFAFNPVVVGDAWVIEDTLKLLKVPLKTMSITSTREAEGNPEAIYILDQKALDPEDFRPGGVSAACGKAAVHYLQSSVELALSEQIDGIISAPINKAAVQAAGYDFIDQAEFFSKATGVAPEKSVTMLTADKFRSFMTTKHIPLAAVASSLSVDRIVWVIQVAWNALRRIGIAQPKLAVAALNPHAGESGLLGGEEIEVISPAIEKASQEGYPCLGPVPAKNVFEDLRKGLLDGVVAMYHDQTAPVSLLGGPAATVTLGLPIVRTSLGHGTAFDIAWKGMADESTCLEAMALTTKLVCSPETSE